jgi:hypothetical protein
VGGAPSDILIADLDGDGRRDDIATATGNVITILFEDGEGSFLQARSFGAGIYRDSFSSLAAVDLDNDGTIDLLAVSTYCRTSCIHLLFKDGTVRDVYPGRHPAALIAADFNGDGHPDLATANVHSADVSILLGSPDGSFQEPRHFAAGEWPLSVAAGDWNHDGSLDLAAANSRSNDVSVLLGNGDGTFQEQRRFASGDGPSSVVAGDWNGDERLDLAMANSTSDDLSILLGSGDGTFRPQERFAAGDGPSSLVAGDWNDDARLDLAAASSIGHGVTILHGSGDGSFQPEETHAVGHRPEAVAAGDLNGDGALDLVTANAVSSDVSVLAGNGDGTFAAGREALRFPVGHNPQGLVAADFNGDQRLDLAMTMDLRVLDRLGISVLLGDGGGSYQYGPTLELPADLCAGCRAEALAAGDFTSDGIPDLVVRYFARDTAHHLVVLTGDGEGDFRSLPPLTVGGSYGGQVLAADWNGDGRLDLAVNQSDGVSILLGNGDGTFQGEQRFAAGTGTLVAADVNSDGRLDLVWAHFYLPGNGDGTFQSEVSIAGPNCDNGCSLVAGEFNADGRVDLVVVSGSDVVVLLGNGDGTFEAQETLPSGGQVTAAADFDGDGRLDLAVTNYPGNVSVLLGNGDGTFQTAERFLAGVSPTSLVAADLNGDGRVDLATTNGQPGCGSGGFCGGGSDDVTVLLNLPPGGNCPAKFHRGDTNSSGTIDITDGIAIFGHLFLGGTAPTCRETADVNNDGTIDITDGIALLNWLFLGGPEPAAPGPTTAPCGVDPDVPGSAGDLGCEASGHCN